MRQQSLFPTSTAAPAPAVPGLTVQRDYIDEAEEQRLLAHIEAGSWDADFRRRIQLYGLGYGGDGETAWVRDFPAWLDVLARRIVADGWMPRPPDNCVINDYAPGVGIGPHSDFAAFDAPLVALSLLSPVVIDFRRRGHEDAAAIVLPPRSLWIAAGAARWQWTHAIAARRSDIIDGERVRRGRRLSLTFRVARVPVARP